MSSSLPTLVKTWQFSVNNAVFDLGSFAQNARRLLRVIKDQLLAFGSNPWTVAGSSNGTTAGMDATDRWLSDTDLVYAAEGVAHSWIVLKQAGINSNYHLLINLKDQTNQYITMYVSPNAAFTGGSTTTRPTSTTEFQIMSSAPESGVEGWIDPTSVAPYKWHAQQSTDGQCTRIVVCSNSQIKAVWILDKPSSPHATWTDSAFQWLGRGGRFAALYSGTWLAPESMRARLPYGVSDLRLVCETVGANPFGDGTLEHAMDLEAAWPIIPAGIASVLQGTRLYLGGFFDLYLGADGFTNGDTYPGTGTKLWAQFDNVILPWDGLTVPQVS